MLNLLRIQVAAGLACFLYIQAAPNAMAAGLDLELAAKGTAPDTKSSTDTKRANKRDQSDSGNLNWIDMGSPKAGSTQPAAAGANAGAVSARANSDEANSGAVSGKPAAAEPKPGAVSGKPAAAEPKPGKPEAAEPNTGAGAVSSSEAATTSSPANDYERTFAAASKAFARGQNASGEKLLKDTLKMEDKQGATDLKRAQSMVVLADYYKSQKRFGEAESLYKQLLSKFESENSAGEKMAAVMNKLAGLYKAEGKLDESLALYKRSLELVEKREGADSVSAGTIHENLGLLYQRMGKLKEAESEELTAIKTLQAKLGDNSSELAECMSDLAQQYIFEHKTKQGLDLFEQALAIYTKTSPEGLQYADCAEQLASAYGSSGRWAEAEQLSRKALEIYRKKLGSASKPVAITLTNLGERLSAQGKNQEAMQCFLKSMSIEEKNSNQAPSGSTPGNSANLRSIGGMIGNLHGMAGVYVAQADYKRAEAVLRRDLSLREKKWGPRSEAVLPALKNLANCLVVEGASGEEPDVLLNRFEEVYSQVPFRKKKFVDELIKHDLIPGLDLSTKKSKKNKSKNAIW